MKYIDLSIEDRKDILRRVQNETGKDPQIVEKDWWVTAILRALYELPYSEHISFKGGTSLSKCWDLIRRMSEDVDIAIDREFLGFGGQLTKTQISDKLRRAACSFVREKLQFDLAAQLEKDGFNPEAFKVTVNITPVTTTDPETIEVEYSPAFNANPYIKSKVLIEVSGRSMSEPVTNVSIQSYIDEVYPQAPFFEQAFDVRAVLPQRTFLEKLCLLHEEFSKPQEIMRVNRMSRHIYDICKMVDSPIANDAITDEDLYLSVIEHRRTFIGLRGFDYSTLLPQTLSIIPPQEVWDSWEKDYRAMQESMIYEESPSFDHLIKRLAELNHSINALHYDF